MQSRLCIDSDAAMAIGSQTVETAGAATEEPVGASAVEVGRDVMDALPEERRDGLAQISAERIAKRAESTLPGNGQNAGPVEGVSRAGAQYQTKAGTSHDSPKAIR